MKYWRDLLPHMLLYSFSVQIFCLRFWKALSRLFRKTQIWVFRSFLSEEAVLITMQGCGDCSMLINIGAEHFPSLDNRKPPLTLYENDLGAKGAGCFPIHSRVDQNKWKPVRCLARFPSIKLGFRHSQQAKLYPLLLVILYFTVPELLTQSVTDTSSLPQRLLNERRDYLKGYRRGKMDS